MELNFKALKSSLSSVRKEKRNGFYLQRIMTNIMKRTISLLSILALMLVFTGNIFAQVTASANVISDVTYTEATSLNFGDFQTSFTGTATIVPENSTNDANVNGTRATDYFAGKIYISGAASQTVTVTLDNTSVTLSSSSGSTTDNFALNPITLSDAAGQDGTNEGGSTLSNGGTTTLDGSGNATVWIGGDLTANDNSGDGSIYADIYENTTDLTFTIDYSF